MCRIKFEKTLVRLLLWWVNGLQFKFIIILIINHTYYLQIMMNFNSEESPEHSPSKDQEDAQPSTDFLHTQDSIHCHPKEFAYQMEWEDPIYERPISFSCEDYFNKDKHTVSNHTKYFRYLTRPWRNHNVLIQKCQATQIGWYYTQIIQTNVTFPVRLWINDNILLYLSHISYTNLLPFI